MYTNIAWALLPVTLGFALDAALGDPPRLWHPVRGIGALISGGERTLRRVFSATCAGERTAGTLLAVFIMLVSYALPFFLLGFLDHRVAMAAAAALDTVLCYQALALRSLRDESMAVYYALKDGDIQRAREKVSRIVGRDAFALTEAQIARAAVETVAENCTDAVIAPLMYMFIGGAPLAWLYKSVNTMDSMIGYKNEKYRYFGSFAARTDDVMNFLPARLAAVFMLACVRPCRMDYENAPRIYRRDRGKHSSPNSGQTEAVCAGALDVQLAGDASYFGKLVKKPTIGDPLREITADDIKRANTLVAMASLTGFTAFFIIKLAVLLALGYR